MKALGRIKRVVFLDGPVHKELAADNSANLGAAIAVYVSLIISSVSVLLDAPSYLVVIIFLGLVFWLVSAGLFHVLARVFGGRANFSGYARSAGYCHAPMALGIIPVVGSPLGIIWALACLVVATRETHKLTTLKAGIVVLAPAIALLGVLVMFSVMVGLNAQLILENETLSGY